MADEMKKSEYLKLNLPGENNNVRIEDLSENFELIDSKTKKIDEDIEKVGSQRQLIKDDVDKVLKEQIGDTTILNTSSKEVVGAINENKSNINENKTAINQLINTKFSEFDLIYAAYNSSDNHKQIADKIVLSTDDFGVILSSDLKNNSKILILDGSYYVNSYISIESMSGKMLIGNNAKSTKLILNGNTNFFNIKNADFCEISNLTLDSTNIADRFGIWANNVSYCSFYKLIFYRCSFSSNNTTRAIVDSCIFTDVPSTLGAINLGSNDKSTAVVINNYIGKSEIGIYAYYAKCIITNNILKENKISIKDESLGSKVANNITI